MAAKTYRRGFLTEKVTIFEATGLSAAQRGRIRTRRSRSALSRSRRCDSAALARVKLARNLIFRPS